MKIKVYLILLLSCLYCASAESQEVFCGRNSELPQADLLEKGWTAMVVDGNISKALKAFNAVDAETNKGPALYMGLETVYNFKNRFDDSLKAAADGLRVSRNLPWGEIFLYDIVNISGLVSNIEPVVASLEEVVADQEISSFYRDYAGFHLARFYAKAGRQKKSDELYASLDFIRKGVFCGPFPNRDGAGFSEQYPPEMNLDPGETYQGINRNVGWFSYEAAARDGFVDFSTCMYPYENSVGYAMFSVYIPEDGEYLIHAGTGNSVKIWVNYDEVFANDDKNNLFFDRHVFKTAFVKGWNLIFIKLGTTLDDDDWGLYLRLTDKNGNRISGFSSVFTDEEKIGSGVFSGRKRKSELIQTPAEAFFTKVKAEHPENSVAWGTLGFVYSERATGDREKMESLRLYKKAFELAPKCPLWAELAGAVDKDINKTLKVLKSIVDSNPDAFSLKEKIGSILYSEGFYRSFDRLAEESLAAEEGNNVPYLLYLQGKLFSGRNWFGEGREKIRTAQKLYPRYKPILKALASRAVNENEERAILDSILNVDFTDIWARRRLAEMAWEAGETKEALAQIQTVMEMHPTYFRIYMDLIRNFRDSGDVDGAVTAVKNALKIFPQNPSLKARLAKLYVLRGEAEEGREEMEKALTIDPNLVSLREYLEYLSPVKKEFYEDWDFSGEVVLKEYAGDAVYAEHNIVDLQNVEVVSVKKNGTEERMVHRVRKALTDSGMKALRYVRIPFSSSRSRVDIKYARIIKPDGQIVESDQIGTRSGLNTSSQGATLYSSYQYKIVVFPGLEKGDIVDYQYVKRDTQPDLFSDEFSDVSYLVNSNPAERSRYIVIAPRELKLNVGTFQTDIKPELTPSNEGGYIYSWDVRKWAGIVTERSMRPLSEYLPYVIVSSMDSWNELGKWYYHLSKKQFHMNEEMKETVGNLTKESDSALDKARAIFRFITDEIRYVGIELGRNSYKPHRAESTYTTKYGDCKDTAVLMSAMLKEAGIESNVILVRTRHLGKINQSIPSPYMFNHAICHIPDLEGKSYWLDGTTDFNRMEEVPWMDRNALVLVVSEKGGKITTIPDEGIQAGIVIESTITLKGDGSAQIEVVNKFTGDQAPSYRRMINSPDWFKQRVEQYYSRKFPGIEIDSIRMPESGSIETVPWYSVTAIVKRYALKQGEELLLPCTSNPLSLSGALKEQDREYAYWLRTRMSIEEKSVIKIPDGYKVKFYPEARKKKTENAEFSQNVIVNENTATYSSRLVLTEPTVSPGNYKEYKDFCGFTDSAQEERIILEKK